MKKLEVRKSNINGVGLFVNKPFKKGQIIDYIHGPKVLIKNFYNELSQSTVNWIGASRYTWINTDNSPFRFINHSCDPNTAIKGERTVYAIRALNSGEEITIDYSLNEMEPGWSIPKCSCGSINCRGKIGPIFTLSLEEYKKKKSIINNRFKNLYLKCMKKAHEKMKEWSA
ncbi:MAG TPA: SET domain-containing protein-lysine N-methyltransferase [Candidatus Paceibacterota bacterium]|nr:SET domain-containing protein-lysine N-methyltransferase [Candidatus Paceibacterota bacterium]HMO83075.1 SET domain-containing protein-lysine N-methyltransferase [Candidatus Paceibacterota bacterium]